ncbi:MAG TPA: glycosyl hydrolase family 53 [Phycisphaerales bacterium]|nr:glycosyl hydrolase family 53 [Phycisphaerales bacterium]
MKLKIVLLYLLLYTNLCAALDNTSIKDTENKQFPKSPIGFIKGFSWGTFGRNGDYIGPHAEESMKLLAETNANSATVVFAMSMKTKNSTEIFFDKTNPYMASDDDIRNAIRLAHKNNLKVILKPTVNCNDGAWRGHIESEDWEKWWQSYTIAMVHYAKLAQDTNCAAYCIGCEMVTTEDAESHWRTMVAEIRKHYNGPLVYNTNHGREEKINWWDAVDMIGISAYYPVGTTNIAAALAEDMNHIDKKSSLEQMKKNWLPIRENLRQLSHKWNRPIFFAEIGVRSTKGSSAVPWEYYNDWPYDADEQARYYQAALEMFWNEPWFAGYAWWAWHSHLYSRERAARDRSFCPHLKPAEQILKEWYSKEK